MLLVAAVPSSHSRLVDELFGALAAGFSLLRVSAVMTLLVPVDIADWLGERRLFRADGKFRRAGLIDFEAPRGVTGQDTLPQLDVGLTILGHGLPSASRYPASPATPACPPRRHLAAYGSTNRYSPVTTSSPSGSSGE